MQLRITLNYQQILTFKLDELSKSCWEKFISAILKYPVVVGCFIEIILEDAAKHMVDYEYLPSVVETCEGSPIIKVSLNYSNSVKQVEWIASSIDL